MPHENFAGSERTSAAKTVNRKRTAVVVSVDYDCCADSLWYKFNSRAGTYRYVKEINEYNPLFIDFESAFNQVSDQEKKFFLVGSNRQSSPYNNLNQVNHKNGCCFTNFDGLCDRLDVKFNKMLMADIEEEKDLGFCMNVEYEQRNKYRSSWDEYKFTLLYAQMHAIAEHWPDDLIEFRFYDDREDILHTLIALFEANCAFIPENIDLKLLHFDGNNLNSLPDVNEKAVIIGTSTDYKQMPGGYRELARGLGQKLDPQKLDPPVWHRSITGQYNESYCDYVRSYIREYGVTVNEFSPLQVEFNNWLSSHSLRPADNLTYWSRQVSGLLGGAVFNGVRVPHTVARLMHHVEHIDGNWHNGGYYKKPSLQEIVSELRMVMHLGKSPIERLSTLGLFSSMHNFRSGNTRDLIEAVDSSAQVCLGK